MDKEKAGGNREEKMCHYCVLRMLHNSAVFCFLFFFFVFNTKGENCSRRNNKGTTNS